MVFVAQLVRASGCGPEGRGFETHQTPQIYSSRYRNASRCVLGSESSLASFGVSVSISSPKYFAADAVQLGL